MRVGVGLLFASISYLFSSCLKSRSRQHYSKLQEAQKKVDAKEEELNGLMEVWEQASAELDAFEESLKG